MAVEKQKTGKGGVGKEIGQVLTSAKKKTAARVTSDCLILDERWGWTDFLIIPASGIQRSRSVPTLGENRRSSQD